jgi:hypothetical protein
VLIKQHLLCNGVENCWFDLLSTYMYMYIPVGKKKTKIVTFVLVFAASVLIMQHKGVRVKIVDS